MFGVGIQLLGTSVAKSNGNSETSLHWLPPGQVAFSGSLSPAPCFRPAWDRSATERSRQTCLFSARSAAAVLARLSSSRPRGTWRCGRRASGAPGCPPVPAPPATTTFPRAGMSPSRKPSGSPWAGARGGVWPAVVCSAVPQCAPPCPSAGSCHRHGDMAPTVGGPPQSSRKGRGTPPVGRDSLMACMSQSHV